MFNMLKKFFYTGLSKIKSIYNRVKDMLTVRDIHGLVLGCGHEIEDGHNLSVHPYRNFITLDLCDYKRPDLVLPADKLLDNKTFMDKYRGKLKYVVFENIDEEAISPNSKTGKVNALIAAYELLAENGICIISVGGWSSEYVAFYAKLSGFSYGQYYPFKNESSKHSINFSLFGYQYPMLIVKKTPGSIVIDDNLKKIFKKLNPDYVLDSENITEIPTSKLDLLKVYSSQKEEHKAKDVFSIPAAERNTAVSYDRLVTYSYLQTIRVVNPVPSLFNVKINDPSENYFPNIKRPPINPSAQLIKLKLAT